MSTCPNALASTTQEMHTFIISPTTTHGMPVGLGEFGTNLIDGRKAA